MTRFVSPEHQLPRKASADILYNSIPANTFVSVDAIRPTSPTSSFPLPLTNRSRCVSSSPFPPVRLGVALASKNFTHGTDAHPPASQSFFRFHQTSRRTSRQTFRSSPDYRINAASPNVVPEGTSILQARPKTTPVQSRRISASRQSPDLVEQHFYSEVLETWVQLSANE